MYSVLEEGKLADVYLKNPKAPIKNFINYIQQRIEANAFKQMIPVWLPLHLSVLCSLYHWKENAGDHLWCG